MNVLEGVRIALSMIRANKMRAFFTVLGTVVGVTFLIAVITLIEGMNAYVEKEFKAAIYGVNTVMLRRVPELESPPEELVREWERRPRITFEDAGWLEGRMETPGTFALAAARSGMVAGPGARQVKNVSIHGTSASYFQVREMVIESGRPFSPQEAERGAAVVVIGKDVASSLFDDRNPIGREIRIAGSPYRVIGVLEKRGSLFGISMDNMTISPISSPLENFVTGGRRGTVDELTLQVPDAAYLEPARTEVEGLMRIRRRLHPAQENDFAVETADNSLQVWNRMRTILLAVLPGLVGISLLVGAIVIMNIMLVSVAERTREIGVRKSLGARRRDILVQFLIESSTLSAAGAVAGIALGVGLAKAVEALSPMPASVAPWSVALGVMLGVGVGLGAGVYPAWRAARLDPIIALRTE